MIKPEWFAFGLGFCFGAGIFVLILVQPVADPKACPVVTGQKVVSSSHDSSGHYCTYARADGMTKRKVKI